MATTRQSSAERRQQIVEAALRIISIQGVQRLTAMEIAREVGIADGTIFRHFQNKEEIIDAAIDHLEALLFAELPTLPGEPLERLRRFFLYRLELVRQQPAVVRLAFTDRLAEVAGDASAARFHRMVARSVAFVKGCLLEARERGEVADDVPLEVLVWSVTGILRGAAMGTAATRKNPGDPAPALPSAEQVWEGVEKLLRRSAGGEGTAAT